MDTTGWQKMPGLSLGYTDRQHTTLTIFSRKLDAGEEIEIPQGNWSGMIVLLPP